MMDHSKQAKLSELLKRMQPQLVYDLSKTARFVPGEGSVDAQVLFIGEAPGADEDRVGRPFVGRSGQLLRLNIRKIGWSEQEVYITNVVKHRPPENRDPLPDEIALNRPLLDQQIQLISPLLIVTLGRFSLNTFLPERKISQVRGRVFKVSHLSQKRFVVPLYHPAAALRSPIMKKAFEEDFARLPKIVDKIRSIQNETQMQSTNNQTLQ